MFVIPPLTTTILTPAGARRALRCEQRALMVEPADASAMQPHVPPNRIRCARRSVRRMLPSIAIAAGLPHRPGPGMAASGACGHRPS